MIQKNYLSYNYLLLKVVNEIMTLSIFLIAKIHLIKMNFCRNLNILIKLMQVNLPIRFSRSVISWLWQSLRLLNKRSFMLRRCKVLLSQKDFIFWNNWKNTLLEIVLHKTNLSLIPIVKFITLIRSLQNKILTIISKIPIDMNHLFPVSMKIEIQK
jgi:hypothetical protein